MAGLPTPSIQTVTAKVHLLQSSVLGNTSLEDTQVSHGAVSRAVSDLGMSYFIVKQAIQAKVSGDHTAK